MMTDKTKKGVERVGIYLHIPFCASKCYYCDFCSVCTKNDEKKQIYTDRLCDEISFIAQRIREKGGVPPTADTVYFGGGTPTLLRIDQFERVLDTVDREFGIDYGAEITAEANPNTADGQKLSSMRSLGINRLSIGMQSAQDRELLSLGRKHSFADFVDLYNEVRRAGFDNVSADLMYGIPEQTRDSFADSVRRLASLDPEHISSYCLTVEPNTVFYRDRNKLMLPDEDTVCDMYADMSSMLCDLGYKKYEISNFANKDKESRHNLKYWQCENYLGFGVAAHSYFDGVRFAHSRDVEAYLCGKSIYESVENIDCNEAMQEYVLLGMRLAKGVDTVEFERRFGVSFYEKFGRVFQKYAPEYVNIDEKCCKFTDKGMFVSNFILSDALDFGEK